MGEATASALVETDVEKEAPLLETGRPLSCVALRLLAADEYARLKPTSIAPRRQRTNGRLVTTPLPLPRAGREYGRQRTTRLGTLL